MPERILFIIIILSALSACINKEADINHNTGLVSDTSKVISAPPTNTLFGITVDSFNLITGKIKPNGFLSQIFIKHGISMQEIDQLLKNSSDIFNVRDIRAGRDYTLFCDTDSTERLRYMIYEHDPTTSYIFCFNDSLNITQVKKEITKTIKYSSGIIETSLWESMVNAGMHPSLAGRLSELYAWTVDFFGLQKGDSYKVIYEELFIDEKSLGVGRIFGAEFTWSGKTIVSITYIKDEKE